MKIHAINNVQVSRLNKSKKYTKLQNANDSTNQDGENNINFKGWGNVAKKGLFWGALAGIAAGPVGIAAVMGTLAAKEFLKDEDHKKPDRKKP